MNAEIMWYQTLLSFFLDMGLGLWCLMPLLTIFQLYRASQVLLVEEIRVP